MLELEFLHRLKNTEIEFKNVMEVNLLGTFLMSQGSIKIMKKQNFGKIINIASIYGSTSSDERIYVDSGRNNSRFTLLRRLRYYLTKYMAAHFGKFNIQTNSVSPGGIFNNQSKDFVANYEYKTPMGRMGSTSDVISAIDYLISERASYINGQDIAIDGGFSLVNKFMYWGGVTGLAVAYEL